MKKIKFFLLFLSVFLAIGLIYYFIYINPLMPLFSEAKAIMSGEMIVDEEHPLYYYSFKESVYPETENISYYFFPYHIWLDYKYGYIQVGCTITYRDINGGLVYHGGGQSILHIRKINGVWTVVDVDLLTP